MSEVFDPIKFRLMSQVNDPFVKILPLGFEQLIHATHIDREKNDCGDGLTALGKVAIDFMKSGPQSLQEAIAIDFSLTNKLFTPYGEGEYSLVDREDKRPKEISEFTEAELDKWTRYIAGLDPTSHDISRETAILGLEIMYYDMANKAESVGKYSLSPGESTQVFDRARNILLGTPFVIATEILPDMTADEARDIYKVSPGLALQTVSEYADRARQPLFENSIV